MKLERELLELIEGGTHTVRGIISNLEGKYLEEEIMAVVKSLEKEGKIELQEPIPPSYNLLNYILDADGSLWFHLLTLVTTAVNALIRFPSELLSLPRVILGFIFVLYVPGLALVEALFPRRRDLESYERIALSVGLSIVVTVLTGTMLNYSPFGIRLVPIATSLSLFSITLGFVAVIRRFKAAARVNKKSEEE